jgi:hypothetical protein
MPPIRITAVFNPMSSKEAAALITEPPISEEVFAHFVELCKQSNEMLRYAFELKEGMLVMRMAEKGKPIIVRGEDHSEIVGKLVCAEDADARIQEQAMREQLERKQVLDNVAKVFGVDVVDERGRRLDFDL